MAMKKIITLEEFGTANPQMSTKCQICGRRFGLHYDVWENGKINKDKLECPITKFSTRIKNLDI
jgi:hypothetical protein